MSTVQTTETEPSMTSNDVRSALHGRWPDSEYLHIDEAPMGSDRQGRKLDRLVISLWNSRGHQRDGVEIKVSMSDFRTELKDGDKAEWWYQHVHRFWIAAPAEIAKKIKPELPPTWGLLAATRTGTRVLVQAPVHDADDIPAPTYVGLMRASANSGVNALHRARQDGYEEGYKAAGSKIEQSRQASYAQQRHDDLKAAVERFEEASGVKIGNHWSAGNIGAAVSILTKTSPDRLIPLMEVASAQLRRSADASDRSIAALREALNPTEPQLDLGASA